MDSLIDDDDGAVGANDSDGPPNFKISPTGFKIPIEDHDPNLMATPPPSSGQPLRPDALASSSPEEPET